MNFNAISSIESCYLMIKGNGAVMSLVYYSHIPTAIISLIVGFFVYFKNRQALANKALLAITVSFSMWSLFDLITWKFGYNSVVTMFSWSTLGLFNTLIFLCSLYFVYVFIDNHDISLSKKLIGGLLILPIIFLTPTRFNLSLFNITNCEAVEGDFFTNYYYYLSLAIFLWILLVVFLRYRKAEVANKKQILLIGIGVELFLLSFFATNFLASLVDNYTILIYGMFGMVVFLGVLAYMIVKFKAFEIKLIGVQALVVTLIVIIGSQFAFIISTTNKILTAITLVLAISFGWILIRSVKKEVQQKEELEIANAKIDRKNEQLEIANEKLKQLDSAKTEFISMASHQLRTPVTGIKGYTSMLIEGGYGEVTPEQKAALKKTYESNDRMSALIEDLLNVSKIESGKLEYEFSKFKMEQICQEVVDTLFPKAKDHNLYLEYKPPKKALPELLIDGTKVREVISNLVDNAVKYTPKGGVKLTLELCAKNEPNCLSKSHIRITVSDTGIGVPPEEMAYLFLKFSRGKDVHRLNATGTGLGLFVGKKMIEGNGGKIWIESEGKDKGSRFIVELPVVREEDV